ncbi:PEPxxWA-CTERM sorting domain-containing protein [Sphingomonas bacterium]|uniref:PEPxxWA-CTERM sorting domain-containing protein n=1 Tax=Sphingomonas bacterium TaxID=1895847 RepID=UPI0020C69BB3|nr:PEPxxWA-CTERM sorting domain-containing protein [Sphingomonas bacterium]
MKMSMLAAFGALAICATGAQAQVELVKNGNFSSTYSLGTQNPATPSQLGYNGYGATGWTSPTNGYNFIYNPTLAGSAGYSSSGQYGNVSLYTSANGGSATAPASLVSPPGGNFLAADPAFQAGAISQLITGLTVGNSYALSFFWAGSQQAGFSGTTTEGWTGSLGGTSFATPVITTPSQGFYPWQKFSTVIKATSTSETLSFLAVGGPSGGQPPFALLDGVSLTAVPEPATWGMMILGFGLAGVALRRQARRSDARFDSKIKRMTAGQLAG